MPTRGEWLVMLVGSVPAAFAAALMRRVTVLGEILKIRSWGSASSGRIRAIACAVKSDMGATAPCPVWSVLDRRILTTLSPCSFGVSMSIQRSARSSLLRRAASWASAVMAMSTRARCPACSWVSMPPPGRLRLGRWAVSMMRSMSSHRNGSACRGVHPSATQVRFSPAISCRISGSWAGLGSGRELCLSATAAR